MYNPNDTPIDFSKGCTPEQAGILIRMIKLHGAKYQEVGMTTWTLEGFTYTELDDGKVQFNQLRHGETILYTE
jgi:hypothetical protein